MSAGRAEAVVVDASVATKWHLKDEEHAQQALLLLERFMTGQTDLWAPTHIRYEVPSAITAAGLGRQPRVLRQAGQAAIAAFLALGLRTVDTDELILSAYALVHEHGCAFYDALYLALAQRIDVPLVTADRTFYQRVRRLPNVVWLGDYPPTSGHPEPRR